jgi:hypothetical protein
MVIICVPDKNDAYEKEFIDWIESRKEYFGRGIKPCDDEEY